MYVCKHFAKLLESLLAKYITSSITSVSVSTEEDSFVTMDLLSVSEFVELKKTISHGCEHPKCVCQSIFRIASGPPRNLHLGLFQVQKGTEERCSLLTGKLIINYSLQSHSIESLQIKCIFQQIITSCGYFKFKNY